MNNKLNNTTFPPLIGGTSQEQHTLVLGLYNKSKDNKFKDIEY